MNGSPFTLATLAKPGLPHHDGNTFVAIVMGDDAVDLTAVHETSRCAT